MKAGAIEFLAKPFDDQDLLDAIHHGIDIDRTRLSDGRRRQELQRRFDELGSGERAVMALVVRGLLDKQIAGELGVSEIAVKVRRRRAKVQMGARSLPEAVRIFDALPGTG